MIPSNGHQNYVVQGFMAKFFIADEIHRKIVFEFLRPKLTKYYSFGAKNSNISHIPFFHISTKFQILEFSRQNYLMVSVKCCQFLARKFKYMNYKWKFAKQGKYFFCSIQIFFISHLALIRLFVVHA